MNHDDVTRTQEQINHTIDRLAELRDRMDIHGNDLDAKDKELIKLVLVSDEMPELLHAVKWAVVTESHDTAHDAIDHLSSLLRRITGKGL